MILRDSSKNKGASFHTKALVLLFSLFLVLTLRSKSFLQCLDINFTDSNYNV